jgi:hypothetical protein
VVQLFHNQDKVILRVTIHKAHGGNETLGATAEHPFHVDGKGWVQAGQLQIGDVLSSWQAGETQTVQAITHDAQHHDTYNFEVTDYHTYFVGNDGVWVHNSCRDIFKSLKDWGEYPTGFAARQNGTVKNVVNNKELLSELREVESGQWFKVYKDGYDVSGSKISIHYFTSQSGKIFNPKIKDYWSNP